MSYPEDQFDPSSMRAMATPVRQPLQDITLSGKTTDRMPCYLATVTSDIESNLCALEKELAALKEQLMPILDTREQPNAAAADIFKDTPDMAKQRNIGPVSKLDHTMADLFAHTQQLNSILNNLKHKIQL
jgi:hypothetical protein